MRTEGTRIRLETQFDKVMAGDQSGDDEERDAGMKQGRGKEERERGEPVKWISRRRHRDQGREDDRK